MRGLGRWRIAAGAVVVFTALAALAAAHWAAARYVRATAERLAATTAAYVSLVSPAARGSNDYDLPRLLIQARALRLLAEWEVDFEVYHGTAPLVEATGQALSPTQLDDLRRRETVRWVGGRALAPLKDRDGRDVVGAVAVAAAPGRVALPSVLAVGALVLVLLAGWLIAKSVGAVGAGGSGTPGRLAYAAAALLLGLAAYGDVRHAATAGTERWLSQTRLLLREAAQRLPAADAATLAVRLGPIAQAGGPMAAGGKLTVGDSADAVVRLEGRGGAGGGGGGSAQRGRSWRCAWGRGAGLLSRRRRHRPPQTNGWRCASGWRCWGPCVWGRSPGRRGSERARGACARRSPRGDSSRRPRRTWRCSRSRRSCSRSSSRCTGGARSSQ